MVPVIPCKVTKQLLQSLSQRIKVLVTYLICFSMMPVVSPSNTFAGTLSVQISGNGSGSVNSDPSGIACTTGNNGTCTAAFHLGPNVNLLATTGSNSIFNGWSGDCFGSGNCVVNLTDDKYVSATFNKLPNIVKSGDSIYGSLNAAYRAAGNDSSLLAIEKNYNEALKLDRGIKILLRGGFDPSFQSNSGRYSTLNGKLTISAGSLVVENIFIREGIAVPNVVGMPLASAESVIEDAELTVGTISSSYSSTVMAGSIISQDPAAGLTVAVDTAVNLEMSLGPMTVTVPELAGHQQTAATVELATMGLAVGIVSFSASTSMESGQVISQDPPSGAAVLPGTAINLVISTGPPPEITGISPSSGKPGDSITISGTTFEPDVSKNYVRFTGTLASAQVVSATAQTLEIIVPSAAISGPITLTNSHGSATSSQSFAVERTMTLSPAGSSLVVSSTIRFTCLISGMEQRGIQWTLNGSTSADPAYGTLTTTGRYTAPATVPSNADVTVRCASTVDPTLFKESTISIIDPVEVNIGSAVVPTDKGITVESFHGFATLEVPPQAVPFDTPVAIEALTPGMLPTTTDSVNLSAVRLTPSGLVFNQPVKIVFSLPGYEPGGALLPVYYLNESTGIVTATGQNAVVDATGLKAEAWISHFSTYILRKTMLPEVKTQAVVQFTELKTLFPQFIVTNTDEIPMLEGLSVPVVIKRDGGPGTGPGPFSITSNVNAVLNGYDMTTTPLVAGPIRQQSSDGWELGTIINIPTLRSCNEGQYAQATLVIWYTELGTGQDKTMNLPFTIQCLNELEMSGNPYVKPNPVPTGTTLIEDQANGRIALKMVPWQRFLFSEVNIGKGATLHNGLGMIQEVTTGYLQLDVTGNMTVSGELRTKGGNGGKGQNGSGSDSGGSGGTPGVWHAGTGGRGGPATPEEKRGRDAVFGGAGGEGGLKWEAGSWFGFAVDLANVVYDGYRIVASEGSDVTAYADLITDIYALREEKVKIDSNDDNRLNSAGNGGHTSLTNPKAFFDSTFSSGATYPPLGGGGGGGSGKMVMDVAPDSAGAGGGGGGGGAPTLRLFIGGRLFINPGGTIDGNGGDGGQGGNGSTNGEQAAPGGGGGGGCGSQMQIMARKGVVNNGQINGLGGNGGLSGEINDNDGVVLVRSGFGINGFSGALRLDGRLTGNKPNFELMKGPGVSATNLVSTPMVSTSSSYCQYINQGDVYKYPVQYVLNYNMFELLVNGVRTGYMPYDGYGCFTLTQGLNLLAVKAVHTSTQYIDMHPWQFLPVFHYPSPTCGNNILEAGEQCDGDKFPTNKDTCQEFNYSFGGSLSCNSNCTINTSACLECDTCVQCNGQACFQGHCTQCLDDSECCAPLLCVNGECQLY